MAALKYATPHRLRPRLGQAKKWRIMADLERERWSIDFGVSKSNSLSCVPSIVLGLDLQYFQSVDDHLGRRRSGQYRWREQSVCPGVFDRGRCYKCGGCSVGIQRQSQGPRRTLPCIFETLRKILRSDAATHSQLAEWRRLEIEMDEPGVIDWLERRCAAEEAAARGAEMRPEWKLNKLQVLLSQFSVWSGIPRRGQPSR